MFKWIRSRRPRREPDVRPESAEDKRDSGEDEYASQEEDDPRSRALWSDTGEDRPHLKKGSSRFELNTGRLVLARDAR